MIENGDAVMVKIHINESNWLVSIAVPREFDVVVLDPLVR